MRIEKRLMNSKNPNIKLPYVLYIPEDYPKDSNLIVELATPRPSDNKIEEIIKDMIEKKINSNSMDYTLHQLIEELHYPAILPIIPRINNFYTTYLGSKVIHNDFSNIKNITEKEKDILSNIDKQVKDMIIEATTYLGIEDKAIIKGYSATAKFATQFSILHPEVIAYNISGGTGGLSTLPTNKLEGIELPYPIGTARLDYFDEESFRKIKHFFYIGKEDINNPAMPLAKLSGEYDENNNPLPAKDKEGNIEYIYDTDNQLLPFYEDCYTKEEINIIHNLYGDDNLKRFQKNAKIYDELGIDSIHKIYPGNHNTVLKNNREEILEDILNCIKKEKTTTNKK